MPYQGSTSRREFGLVRWRGNLLEVSNNLPFNTEKGFDAKETFANTNNDNNEIVLKYHPSASEKELYGHIKNQTSRLWPCETVQVFAQMWALESLSHMYLPRLCKEVDERKILPVRRLILTIRYTDWWEWENDFSLDIADNWHGVNQIPESVEEIVLELETRNGKKAELEEIVDRQLRHWTFRGLYGLVYPIDESRITRSTWLGSPTPGGVWREHHLPDVKEGKMLYYIVKMFWTKMKPINLGGLNIL